MNDFSEQIQKLPSLRLTVEAHGLMAKKPWDKTSCWTRTSLTKSSARLSNDKGCATLATDLSGKSAPVPEV